LSILFLIIGILFFISRSSNSTTNNRIENIFRQLWPSRWIRLFNENEGEGREGGVRSQVNR